MAYRSAVNESNEMITSNIVFGRKLRLRVHLLFGTPENYEKSGYDYVGALEDYLG